MVLHRVALALAVASAGCAGDEGNKVLDSKPPPREANQEGTRVPQAPPDEGPRAGDKPAFTPSPAYREPAEPRFRNREELRRAITRSRERLERLRNLPHTAQAGCEKATFPPHPGTGRPRVIWGPPTPRIVTTRRTGKRVTVRFRFDRLPESPACRPRTVRLSVTTGKLGSRSFRPQRDASVSSRQRAARLSSCQRPGVLHTLRTYRPAHLSRHPVKWPKRPLCSHAAPYPPSLPTSRETVMTRELLSLEGEIGAGDVVDGDEQRCRWPRSGASRRLLLCQADHR